MADRVNKCIASIYEAVAQRGALPSMLRLVAELMEADHAVIGPVKGASRAAFHLFDAEGSFSDHYRIALSAGDKLYERLAAVPEPVFVEPESPYGSTLSKPRFGFTVHRKIGGPIALSLVKVETPSEAQLTCLEVLRSHLQNALDLREREILSSRSSAITACLLDRSSVSAAIVDRDAFIIHANPALSVRNEIFVQRGCLRATLLDDQLKLDQLIDGALQETPFGTSGGCAILRSEGRSRPLLAYAIRLPDDTESPLLQIAHHTRLLITVVDPSRDNLPALHPMLRLLGLTRTEARVADLIARGAALDHISQVCSIEPSTARVHLKRIYAKLSVTGQLELSVLLHRSANPYEAFEPHQTSKMESF